MAAACHPAHVAFLSINDEAPMIGNATEQRTGAVGILGWGARCLGLERAR